MRTLVYADDRGKVIAAMTLDDAESLAAMLPDDDGFTRDLRHAIEAARQIKNR